MMPAITNVPHPASFTDSRVGQLRKAKIRPHIVVIGGGLVGLTALDALAQAGFLLT
jgi:NADPH-dependent 2,4-dienoyl-CoA reductase/sulfur reductase-like enzyme